MVGGGEAGTVAVEAVGAGRVTIERGDVSLSGNGKAGGPIGGVDDETAERLVFKIRGGAHRGRENFGRRTGLGFVETGPDDGHRGRVDGLLNFGGGFFDVIGGCVGGAHAFEDEAADEDLGIGRRGGFVDVAGAEEFADAA